jgi:hypothetical protein
MESDASAVWLMDHANAKALCNALGPSLTIKQQLYNVLVYNIPTMARPRQQGTFTRNPRSQQHQEWRDTGHAMGKAHNPAG